MKECEELAEEIINNKVILKIVKELTLLTIQVVLVLLVLPYRRGTHSCKL